MTRNFNQPLATKTPDVLFVYNKLLECASVSIDSRTINLNDFFIAINGEQMDGNEFAKEALDKGAKYALIDNPKFNIDDRTILVDNTVQFLQLLAKEHRNTLTPMPLIAVAGSNGKTTTKELIYRVLNAKYKTFATPGNWNNHIGVPLSILSIDNTYDVAVIEIGANHIGEHKLLCDISQPTIGIITNCGKDHLEGYETEAGVIQSNNELYDYLSANNGLAIVNSDDIMLNQLSTNLNRMYYGSNPSNTNLVVGDTINHYPFIQLKVHSSAPNTDPFIINSQLYGGFQKDNILAATAIGRHFNINDSLIKNAVENYIPTNNRSQVIEWNNNTILLDSYNANPSSMALMINDFSNYPVKNKILILGDMRELGKSSKEEHHKIIQIIKKSTWKQIILVGDAFSVFKHDLNCVHFENNRLLKKYLEETNFHDCFFLVKGSRGIALEKAFSNGG